MVELEKEAKRATKMLKGKTISEAYRHRVGDVAIVFTDGTRFFIDHQPEGLEFSITLGSSD